ncbi:uncharacterized protein A4U43_C06F11510 [Asparagus officinalis]|uniref:AAA+ ATPase domain-containing protein n=1 Tax=Asparagus officinalis TaxID=4686 RepID=A0A5P1EL69_ASPOF|nr:uncharacterized protein ycf45 [Asparagus officinalis]ONK66745.1 uncharacterized protein A4U43_C06F11510 [Asparagus officinalis]
MLRLFLSPPPIPPPPLSTRQSHRRRLLPLLRCSPQLPSHGFADELGRLLVLLPQEMKRKLEAQPELEDLVEVVMDLGRRPLARFPSGDIVLSDFPISSEDVHHAASQVGDFAADNRAGISRTLHRISAIRNRKGGIVGLTCRVGRAVPGSANMLRDLVKDGGSLLLIGPPGVGKTTVIRDIARILADDYMKRVMIVDTSNEIGGDGDIPHPGIGNARRLQVPNPDMQHKVLIEAVENHMPEVIVIDEVGTKLEAMAASTIAQRGIQLVATAHGVTIENLLMNPSLEMLVGGVQSVTLGDEEASRRGVQKTVLERKGPSTFTCAAEIISKTKLQVHRSLEATVDALLAGRSPIFEVCKLDSNESMNDILHVQTESSNGVDALLEDDVTVEDNFLKNDETITLNTSSLESAEKITESSSEARAGFHLFVYGITETSVLQAIKQLGMEEDVGITDNISEADAFLSLHSKLKKNSQIQSVVKSRGIAIHVTKTSSLMQITKAIRALTNGRVKRFKEFEPEATMTSLEKNDALEEARLAIEQVVIPKEEQVQLLPRPSCIISMQIELIERYKLKWEKVGREPHFSLCILPLPLDTKEKGPLYQVVDTGSELEDMFSLDDMSSSQNGVARLPLLPD